MAALDRDQRTLWVSQIDRHHRARSQDLGHTVCDLVASTTIGQTVVGVPAQLMDVPVS